MLARWRSENVDGGGDADRRGVPERFSRRRQHEARPRVASRGGGQGCFEAVITKQPLERQRECVCRREVPAFVLLRRLTFTSITTNDHPVLLLLPETLSSAPCIATTFFKKIQRIFKFFLFGKHHIHSSHTHTSFFERLLFALDQR